MFIQCTLPRHPRADARCLCMRVCDLGSRWSTQRQTMSLEASVDARLKNHSKKQLRPSAAPGIFIYKTQISYISLLTHPVFITPSLSLPHLFTKPSRPHHYHTIRGHPRSTPPRGLLRMVFSFVTVTIRRKVALNSISDLSFLSHQGEGMRYC